MAHAPLAVDRAPTAPRGWRPAWLVVAAAAWMASVGNLALWLSTVAM